MPNSQTIAVIGDFLQDKYYFGTASRVSPEAPCLIVKVNDTLVLPGGAGNVLANVRSLGANAKGFGSWGPIKNRLMVGTTQIVRWDETDQCVSYDPKDLNLNGVDKIIIADYGKGTITNELLTKIFSYNIPTFVDTKSDPAQYVGFITAIFPNRSEFLQYRESYSRFDLCVLKLGKDGIAELEFGKVKRAMPAISNRPISVNGCGDSVIAAYAVRWPARDTLAFANLAAAVAVEKELTATVTLEEIDAVRRRLRRENRKNKRRNCEIESAG